MSFYTEKELKNIGFKSVGYNVQISKKTSFYGVSRIDIGNNVRIDDFCVISAGEGGLKIGNYVHIAVYCSLIGQAKIELDDFSGVSSRVSIYSSNDDYSGQYMTNPTVPDKYKNVTHKEVYIGKHVIVGAGSIVLPGVQLAQGVAVGALSLVTKSFDEFVIIVGNPAKKIKNRKKDMIDIEEKYFGK